ncbi:sedoheptulose-1,7-bisphosphatase [Parathielavia appendiculata]|uniref:Sedoheptulose-1,7-bisphosphatase n=1 Tax=Parathielavia appendiculata TaxID=2587402 RepID=A0AAN6U624_9PEZI|nr:sedoheptulose-1,7-bisphosphatase [Parathielavia appendiculata]
METIPLETHLRSLLPVDGTREALITSVIPRLLQSVAAVADALRKAHNVIAAGTANTFGDHQLNVDVTAENLIRNAILNCPSIVKASSEEDPVERPVHPASSSSPTEQYTLAFDPLDGSSIISANWTVGTIFSLWDGASALNQLPSRAQIAAILGVLGPRTTAIIALRMPDTAPSQPVQTCLEVSLDPYTSTWHITRPSLRLSPRSTYFSPANLRAAAEDEAYMSIVNGYITRQYTLRYAGGLVPDVVRMLVQGQGVYLSPATAGSKAKLRRLYELCPLALVVECAGGEAVDPVDGCRVLDKEVRDCGEKGALVCGSAMEVGEAVGKLLVGTGEMGA